MDNSSILNKKQLRQEIRQQRTQLSPEAKKEKDRQIERQLLEYLKRFDTIGLYVSLPQEVDTWELLTSLLKQGKKVAVPRCEKDDLQFVWCSSPDELKIGCFQVYEPTTNHIADVKELDCIVVPLIAFDRKGYRCGYGKGYYDRALQNYPQEKIGLAYAFQEVNQLPFEPHDVPLNRILTEKEWILV